MNVQKVTVQIQYFTQLHEILYSYDERCFVIALVAVIFTSSDYGPTTRNDQIRSSLWNVKVKLREIFCIHMSSDFIPSLRLKINRTTFKQ